VPKISGYNGQEGVESFLTNYIDENGLVTLDGNQAIVLFELGTTNLSSASADFQDLVTLISLRRSITPLTDTEMAQIILAKDLLVEAERSLAECAIQQGICGDGDTLNLASAQEYFQDAQSHSLGDRPVDASEAYKKVWRKLKRHLGTRI